MKKINEYLLTGIPHTTNNTGHYWSNHPLLDDNMAVLTNYFFIRSFILQKRRWSNRLDLYWSNRLSIRKTVGSDLFLVYASYIFVDMLHSIWHNAGSTCITVNNIESMELVIKTNMAMEHLWQKMLWSDPCSFTPLTYIRTYMVFKSFSLQGVTSGRTLKMQSFLYIRCEHSLFLKNP